MIQYTACILWLCFSFYVVKFLNDALVISKTILLLVCDIAVELTSDLIHRGYRKGDATYQECGQPAVILPTGLDLIHLEKNNQSSIRSFL